MINDENLCMERVWLANEASQRNKSSTGYRYWYRYKVHVITMAVPAGTRYVYIGIVILSLHADECRFRHVMMVREYIIYRVGIYTVVANNKNTNHA